MSSTAKFRVVQTTGTYENGNGEKKNNYQEIGVVLENEKGYLSMKMNVLPLPNKEGEVWLNMFPIEKAAAAKPKK